jgi:hypothetical protein
MKTIKILFALAVIGLAGACASAPAETIPPVADEVNTVRPVEKPGAPGEAEDDGFGEFDDGSAADDSAEDSADGPAEEAGDDDAAGEATEDAAAEDGATDADAADSTADGETADGDADADSDGAE